MLEQTKKNKQNADRHHFLDHGTNRDLLTQTRIYQPRSITTKDFFLQRMKNKMLVLAEIVAPK